MDLYQLGQETARKITPTGRFSGHRAAREVGRCLDRIEAVRKKLSRRSWERLPSGVEWLLDNAYLAQREGKLAQEELRRGKRLRAAGREGYLQTLVRPLARHAPEGNREELAQYLGGLQSGDGLTEEELSLFVPTLRGELCRRLATLCEVLETELDGEELARDIGAVFTGLRTLSTTYLGSLLEESSPVEQLLLMDPAGAYGEMDEATRARYRHQVCLLAHRHGLTERTVAQKALELARAAQGEERHIGWFLFRRPLGEREKSASGLLYVGLILISTLFLALWLGYALESWVLFLLLLLPASDLMKNLADFVAVHVVRPRPVLRMALQEGIPSEGKTLCVIAGLLTGDKSGDGYAALLERYRLANRDSGEFLSFGLLADLPDRAAPMGLEQRRWVQRAADAIDALNEKYGGGYYLFFRQPTFQATNERYVGWERKRGALLELSRLLRGQPSGVQVRAGAAKELKQVKYVITLDSDTALNVGTAKELVGAMLHPLNRPHIDPRRRVVTEGYGLLQPRVGVDLSAANHSQFSRIFAGQGGIDPYGGACSDVYHDLFDRGTYTGKGIFDVDAFLECLDGRFPEERILSHDLLEGAYLHAGLLEDVELSDGYPYKVTSYFSRLHRWVRGDWQLLPWLGRRVRNGRGEKVDNPITSVDKWKLFDNLRRSLSPVSTLIALLLGMCLSAPAFGAAAAMAIISAWSNLLLTGADLAFRGGTGLHRRYHATIIAGFGGMILQTLVQLLFLPYQAWVCASAIVTALWRSLVSHRNMLEWVTAADSEKKKSGLWAELLAQWPAVAVGVAAILFARFPAGAAVGLVWAVSPVFAWAFSRPVQEGQGTDSGDNPFLLHQAALIWGYFRDWLRPEDHWLPPDNVQEKPWLGPARRTSPTNIGMALLSCIAAVDLELAGRDQAVELVSHMIETMEALPKWKGHLYNWYDTSDGAPLRPMYVSTVDSGNLRGCLITLREALSAWGESDLARRAEALSDAMDLSPLYDRERKLFSIGFDLEKGELTQGWYDLMASEARLASYLAVALGEVEPRHWRRLNRGLVGDNNYCGMASWTGTMFEYFMPNLLLPSEPGSLMYESLSFCIYAQKRRGSKTGTPWGISESGFYAFDPGLAYQYKAHGVQTLGLKRGLDKELVVAPYASFLALLLAPRSAGRNLRRLRDLGLEGTYGLYEAVDYTASRLHEGEDRAVVRSFMSHHLGMSLLAIDHALKGNIMQERFLRDCSMGAFRELLQEKVPVGAPVIKPDRSPIERVKPIRQSLLCRTGEGYDLSHPVCHLLSNGLVSALCTDTGAVQLTDDQGETPISSHLRERYAPAGVSFFYRDMSGKIWPLTPAPFLESGTYSWSFDGVGATWSMVGEHFSTKQHLSLPRGERGALWTVTLEGVSGGDVICYLEPVLARAADHQAHPAYSKLSIESSSRNHGVDFTRRPRKGDRRATLSVRWDREETGWDTSRESALGRGGLRRLAQALEHPQQKSAGAVLDPCLLVRFPVAGKGTYRLRLALGAEDDPQQADRTAAKILLASEQPVDRLDGLLRRLQLSTDEGRRAMELLAQLVFPPKRQGIAPQSDLWAWGVSGDLPIAVVLPPKEGEEVDGFPFRAHALLAQCGYAFDLVCLLTDGGNYLRPQKNEVVEAIKALGLEGQLGRKGGIHLVECTEGEPDLPWSDWAAVWMDRSGHWTFRGGAPAQPPILPCSLEKEKPAWEYTGEGEFTLRLDGGLPGLGWSHLLVGENFGWLTDETGCGHLWQGNARECPITPWNNDPLAIGGPEWFILRYQGESRSLFADGDGCPVTVTYGFGWARWEKRWKGGVVKTTAIVPWGEQRRLLLVELPTGEGELRHITVGGENRDFPIDGRLCLSTTGAQTEAIPPEEFHAGYEATLARWRGICRTLTVETPDHALNHYFNGWCLYQVVACRLLARTSRYQNGGAYGFRDQLQDTLATLSFDPAWTKEQILRCCAHQFAEGDVQHWWHEVGEEKNRGVRTRISDDLLWLPYALAQYYETWGDDGFLSVQVKYLSGEPLKEGEHERYYVPGSSDESEDVYGHALRAIRCVLKRGTGGHGLLKIGTGDWNDGMNSVGEQGKGESVWLTWFAVVVLEGFGPLAAGRGDRDTENLCQEWAARLREAAEKAWDGEWYLRGWYDDGSPLGSCTSEECQIDSLPQSWAVLAGADGKKGKTAIHSALERLFEREAGVVKLFDPPFDRGTAKPGYIRGYLPGIRENGGQYTHAAPWLALACFRLGWNEEGRAILHALLPETHPQEIYRAEPYVLAGDVYTHPDHLGRGGWSWYTGSAGWYHQAVMQGLLGMEVKKGMLTAKPALPEDWPGWSARWKTERGSLQITVRRGQAPVTLLDGKPVEAVPLREITGAHCLEVIVAEEEKP